MSEKKIYKYEFKLTKFQSSKMKAAQEEMFYQYRTSQPKEATGILFLRVTDSLESAFGCFIPRELAEKVVPILEDWFKREGGGMIK